MVSIMLLTASILRSRYKSGPDLLLPFSSIPHCTFLRMHLYEIPSGH